MLDISTYLRDVKSNKPCICIEAVTFELCCSMHLF